MPIQRRKYEDAQESQGSQEDAYDPHIKALLQSNETRVPQYADARMHARAVPSTASMFGEIRIPVALHDIISAPIFEAEFVKALERAKYPEAIWVYWEGPSMVYEHLARKPTQASLEAEKSIRLYLDRIEQGIVGLFEKFVDQDIFTSFMKAKTVDGIKDFFSDYRPNKNDWRGYIAIAEHVIKAQFSEVEFRINVFCRMYEVMFFVPFLMQGYKPEQISKVFEECLSMKRIPFPDENWSSSQAECAQSYLTQELLKYEKENPKVMWVKANGKTKSKSKSKPVRRSR